MKSENKTHKAENTPEAIRDAILDAAEARFIQYGYGKTTMAEIATDIDMSTANLYRYFENKLDIGAAMAERCFLAREVVLNKVVSETGLTAKVLLENFVLEVLRYNHEQFSEQPKIFELVDIIISRFPEMINEKMQQDHQKLTAIIEHGVTQNEFAVDDSSETATYVMSAIKQFSTPFFMNMFPLEKMEADAKGVVQLLIKGLAKR